MEWLKCLLCSCMCGVISNSSKLTELTDVDKAQAKLTVIGQHERERERERARMGEKKSSEQASAERGRALSRRRVPQAKLTERTTCDQMDGQMNRDYQSPAKALSQKKRA